MISKVRSIEEMDQINRRSFLSGVLMSPHFAAGEPSAGVLAPDGGVFVPAGQDRFGNRRRVLGGLAIDFKVSSQDTGGALFVIEHTDPHKGGPPRHVHHEQEEWFYVLEGEYALEVGQARYRLRPGDAVLAPRKVPHVWAHVGEGEGKLILTFQPAGLMEAFLTALSQYDGVPPQEDLRRLFQAHGMEIVGPPLSI